MELSKIERQLEIYDSNAFPGELEAMKIEIVILREVLAGVLWKLNTADILNEDELEAIFPNPIVPWNA